jgi:hypothetical protein
MSNKRIREPLNDFNGDKYKKKKSFNEFQFILQTGLQTSRPQTSRPQTGRPQTSRPQTSRPQPGLQTSTPQAKSTTEKSLNEEKSLPPQYCEPLPRVPSLKPPQTPPFLKLPESSPASSRSSPRLKEQRKMYEMIASLNKYFIFAAGAIFCNKKLVLAGTQLLHKKKHSHGMGHSGFGGNVDSSDLNVIYTAGREVLEELYGLKNISRSLLDEVVKMLIFRDFTLQPMGDDKLYLMFHCNITDIAIITKMVNEHYPLTAPYFMGVQIPEDLLKFIDQRTVPMNAEIKALSLISIDYIDTPVNPYFCKDVQSLKK